MKTRVMLLTVTTLLLAVMGLSTSAAAPAAQEVLIFPYTMHQTYVIGSGEVGVIQFDWVVCTRGLLRAFTRASNFELKLLQDGLPIRVVTPEDIDDLWDPIQLFDLPGPGCRPGHKPAHTRWQYVLSGLPPGEYELRFRAWLDHPVTDGIDYDGDGAPDVIHPEDFGGQTVNYIEVLGS
jgi:hypothetical protein